jgi:hypothetical protein
MAHQDLLPTMFINNFRAGALPVQHPPGTIVANAGAPSIATNGSAVAVGSSSVNVKAIAASSLPQAVAHYLAVLAFPPAKPTPAHNPLMHPQTSICQCWGPCNQEQYRC